MNLLEDDNPNEELTLDPNKKYADEIVGEGKRYKTNEDLVRSKLEADHYIELLKRQKDELRADYLKMREETMAKASLEELIKQQALGKTDEHKSQEQKPYDPTEIEKLLSTKISESLNAYELSNRQKTNSNLVKEKLIERFGKNYRNTVKDKLEELDISEELFNQMAQNHPTMLIKTLEMDKPPKTEQFQSPPRSSGNYTPPSNTRRTWSYYQELKKANPKLYLDPKTTNQMQKDYMELGDSFEDGDFKIYGDSISR